MLLSSQPSGPRIEARTTESPERWLITNSSFRLIFSAAVLLISLARSCPAPAQEILNPPQGRGHVIVFLSGMAGPKHDKALAEAIAALGYVVVVYDGREMDQGQGQAIRSALENALQLPNALPGKAAVMGVSLGGGFALAYGVRWPDLVAVDIVWYPATGFVLRLPTFASSIRVPVLMFAGESDNYQNCCLITTARSLASDAAVLNVPFELVTYPGAQHDFIKGGSNFNPTAYNDTLERAAAKLKTAFGD